MSDSSEDMGSSLSFMSISISSSSSVSSSEGRSSAVASTGPFLSAPIVVFFLALRISFFANLTASILFRNPERLLFSLKNSISSSSMSISSETSKLGTTTLGTLICFSFLSLLFVDFFFWVAPPF
ncbi:MAG: hypothetical protein BYD32DRAFT_421404 [Podila humilis]|nr:MAG: hypothetical protein BYD32DRAFT_421404 [Podila humilis]